MNEGFTYLTDNNNSGETTLVVTNISDFSTDDPVLIGQFGSETAEIAYISGVNTGTNTLTLENETKFAHPESTRMSKLRYSMVEFIWGDGPDYDALGSPSTSQDIPSLLGDSTTAWTITQVSGRTKYTYVSGPDPRISDYFSYPLPSTGSLTKRAWIYSPNFNSANNVTTQTGAEIYEVGEDYFILNFSGGPTDTAKQTGTGYIKLETRFIDVRADNFFTLFRDFVLTTGFGFFRWWNPRSHLGTIVRSPIPYLGYPANSAKATIDDFFSTLNSKELKLISLDDAFRWLSEGYSMALNELNLVNKEYGGLVPFSITTVDGTQEYALPANFSRIREVWDSTNNIPLPAIPYNTVDGYERVSRYTSAYYLRGTKDLETPDSATPTRANSDDSSEMLIGISPIPTGAGDFTVKYIPKAVPIKKNYDAMYLPNNNFYCLKDFMMFRAATKLGRGDGSKYYALFSDQINKMKANALKQDNRLDSWSIKPSANV